MTIVTISYNELNSLESSPDLLEKIAQGFGSDDKCKGIVAITDVPNYSQLRRKSLHLTHALGTTPSHILQKLEDPGSYYSVGWSHGKEKLEADKYDTGKGSFYFNPLIDEPIPAILKRDFDEEMTEEKAKFLEIAKKNGAFYAPNIWPKDVLPELQSTSMEMGQLIHHVGKLLAKHCDQYVASKCGSYQENKLYDVIDKSLCCKARLLHYFPVSVDENETKESAKEQSFSDLCGWHNDHGSLTGLLPAMYFNQQGEEISCPDPDAGLYIKARNGELFQAKIPSNALAFQIGGEFRVLLSVIVISMLTLCAHFFMINVETSQIHTGGLLQATPHAVRGCDPTKDGCKGVSREAFAVFMEPE